MPSASPTPIATLELDERPGEGLVELVTAAGLEVTLAPGSANMVEGDAEDVEDEEDEEDVDDVDDVVDAGVVAAAKCQPLICTPTTCVELSTVLVSDHVPVPVRV